MPRVPRKAGAFGPYQHGRRWRVVLVDERGGQTCSSYATEAEARQVVRSLKRKIALEPPKTIDEAIDDYEVYLRDWKQNKAKSYTATTWRLRAFFADVDELLGELTEKRCASYYDALTKRVSRTGKAYSVDSHRNILAEAKTFLGWCAKDRRWIRSNPVERVKGQGRRRHGKPQLRIDEARAWTAKAIEFADRGEAGAVAAMVTVLMGLRCSEIVSRVVRDLDDGGRLLWIPDSKTEAGRRTLEVPVVLQPYLQRLCEGKPSDATIFGVHWRDWPRVWVKKICRAARVMEVSAHAMRGLHSTLALQAGATGHLVAASLGHESPSTTMRSYADASTVRRAKQRAALSVLVGGLTK